MCFSTNRFRHAPKGAFSHRNTAHSVEHRSVTLRFNNIYGERLKVFLEGINYPDLAAKFDRHDSDHIVFTFVFSLAEVRELKECGFWDNGKPGGYSFNLLIELANQFPQNVSIEEYKDVYGNPRLSIHTSPIRGQVRLLKDIYQS